MATRITERDTDFKKGVTNRLKSVTGHLHGIIKMVEDDQYCIDIIQQIQAVQSALDKVALLLLDDHMHHCVTDAIRSEDQAERERVLSEIHAVFEAQTKLR